MSKYTEALGWATAYCSRSEHCLSEVVAKLDKYELSAAETQRLLQYLQDEKYIDEARYAQAYVKDQFRFAHWGRLKIAQYLRMKHISDENIHNALDEIPQDEYMQVLRRLVQEKQKNSKAKTPYELSMKLLRFAYGRGFEPEHIKQCLTISDDF